MRKRGFTLVELLVVIAIIGVLVALLLPAVQAAREAARRMQCSNRLKQLALSHHNYHDTFKTLPPAYISRDQTYNHQSNTPYWGWASFVLPFMEQGSLHEQLDVGNIALRDALTDATRRTQMRTPLSGFRCPSDTGPPINPNWRSRMDGVNTSMSNYMGNNGSGFWYNDNSNTRIQAGIFSENFSCRFRDILDGTSNVVLIGEKRYRYKRASGALGTSGAGNIFGIRRRNQSFSGKCAVMASGRTKLNYDNNNDGRAHCGFSSNHPAGAMFALCDGSVRFVPETVESDHQTYPDGTDDQARAATGAARAVDTVWEKMLARQDGEPVEMP